MILIEVGLFPKKIPLGDLAYFLTNALKVTLNIWA